MGEIATLTAPAEVEDAGSATLRISNGAHRQPRRQRPQSRCAGEETIEIDGAHGRLDMPEPLAPRRRGCSASPTRPGARRRSSPRTATG